MNVNQVIDYLFVSIVAGIALLMWGYIFTLIVEMVKQIFGKSKDD